jgi:hypothetical protein
MNPYTKKNIKDIIGLITIVFGFFFIGQTLVIVYEVVFNGVDKISEIQRFFDDEYDPDDNMFDAKEYRFYFILFVVSLLFYHLFGGHFLDFFRGRRENKS